MLKIFVDENMPYAQELFSYTGQVLALPGRFLPENALVDIDGLMVRSVTQVNEVLLQGKSVKFVGSATAGTDHIDKAFLKQAGIAFFAALGCNAIAVVEYVFSSLLLLAERDAFDLRDRTVGIVGVGNIGSCLQKRLEVWGVKTLLCDPPRADHGDKSTFLSLDTLVQKADILTFHTPLYKKGPYKTWHLADLALLQALKPGTILVNTCRGPVIDNDALLTVLKTRDDLRVVLDVWEWEPNISVALLEKVDIATAHIAGYTLEGKTRGTIQVFQAWCEFIGQPQKASLSSLSRLVPMTAFSSVTFLYGELDQPALNRLVNLVYDVCCDDAILRKMARIPGAFDRLRKQYVGRREWSALKIICNNSATATLLTQLGFKASI